MSRSTAWERLCRLLTVPVTTAPADIVDRVADLQQRNHRLADQVHALEQDAVAAARGADQAETSAIAQLAETGGDDERVSAGFPPRPLHRWTCVHRAEGVSTFRFAVPGGWIYDHDNGGGTTFVPDPEEAAFPARLGVGGTPQDLGDQARVGILLRRLRRGLLALAGQSSTEAAPATIAEVRGYAQSMLEEWDRV